MAEVEKFYVFEVRRTKRRKDNGEAVFSTIDEDYFEANNLRVDSVEDARDYAEKFCAAWSKMLSGKYVLEEKVERFVRIEYA